MSQFWTWRRYRLMENGWSRREATTKMRNIPIESWHIQSGKEHRWYFAGRSVLWIGRQAEGTCFSNPWALKMRIAISWQRKVAEACRSCRQAAFLALKNCER